MDDLISRQAAIDAHCELCVDRNRCNCDICPDVEVFRLLPSAERTGRWMDAEIPLETGGVMQIQVCNQCKTFYPLAYTGGGHRYCPYCGARMEENDETN